MRRFALSALAAAAVVAGLAWAALPLFLRLEPRGWAGPRLMTPSEIWLLEVFTAGVMGVLLGLAGLGGGWFDARGVRDALEERGEVAGSEEAAPGASADGAGTTPAAPGDTRGSDRGPAWWLVAVGTALLGIYAGGWLLLG